MAPLVGILYLKDPSNGESMADDREDVYSKVVRAGKRTYFFDVRSTRGNDLFLTITESKKHTRDDGSVSYEKHKIFLYKEDFEKFMDGLTETLDELERLRNEDPASPSVGSDESHDPPSDGPTGFSDLDFEDLGKP